MGSCRNLWPKILVKTQGVSHPSQAQFLVQAPDPPAFTIPGSELFADLNFHDQLEDQQKSQQKYTIHH